MHLLDNLYVFGTIFFGSRYFIFIVLIFIINLYNFELHVYI